MSRQRSKDTTPEVEVRRRLHAQGVRFRIDVKVENDLRTRADLAWRRVKLAVFLDGCFWHGCPEHGTRPVANSDWWATKLDKNAERDRRTDAILIERGWVVRRYWEHEAPEEVCDDIVGVLAALKQGLRREGSRP